MADNWFFKEKRKRGKPIETMIKKSYYQFDQKELSTWKFLYSQGIRIGTIARCDHRNRSFITIKKRLKKMGLFQKNKSTKSFRENTLFDWYEKYKCGRPLEKLLTEINNNFCINLTEQSLEWLITGFAKKMGHLA